jgi:uncharacterized protein
MRVLIGILCLLPLLSAQESRHEVTNRDKDDAKPNSRAVPDVYAIPSQFQRVVVLRFKYDTDLLAGLERMVKEQKIKNGVIINGWGSVRGYQIHQVSNRTLPSKNMFVKDPTMPADIAGMSGYVLNGRLHPHITLATPEKAFGGHLEPGTSVFTFAVITIGVLPDDLDLSRLDDKNYR